MVTRGPASNPALCGRREGSGSHRPRRRRHGVLALVRPGSQAEVRRVRRRPPEREIGLEFGLPGMMKKPDADWVIKDLVCEHETRKAFARKCKTQTLFRLKGDKPDEYRAIKAAFTPAVAEQIRRKYGDQLLEIINERKT